MLAKSASLGLFAFVASGCAGFVPSGRVANATGHARFEMPRWAVPEGAEPASCENQPYAFAPTSELRHTRNEVFVLGQGAARAHGRDAIVRVGSDAIVEAKFSYGPFAKDLQDEDVALFVRGLSCAWTRVDTVATDDRGVATFRVPGSLLSEPGPYAFEAVLEANGEAAPGTIYALGGPTRAVVFDVDETLTTGNGELIEQLILDDEPAMRAGAEEIAGEWASAGWFVTYVTGRPHQFIDITRKWLGAHRFPEGLLRTSEGLRVSLPGDATERYKERTLRELKAVGLDVEYAYGNSLADICAYAKASIDPSKTFILGTHAGARCPGWRPTLALESYTEQLGPPILALVGRPREREVATTHGPLTVR